MSASTSHSPGASPSPRPSPSSAPAAPATAAPRPVRRWPSRLAAVASLALFAGGALRVAHWMRERRELSETLAAPKQVVRTGRGVPFFVEPDPRMRDYLVPSARFGPVRRMPFGKDPALFASGSSRARPEVVFAEILKAWAPAQTPQSLEQAVREGPSAVGLLRLRASVESFPDGAALVRLPPAPAALEDGRLRLEPGGVVLGWDYGTKWEYVVFYFPEGLDLDAFTSTTAPPADSIAVLGREGRETLVPELRVGGDEPGEPSTVLCRARGPAGAALDRVAAGLAARGFQDVAGSHVEGEEEQVVRILEGPKGTIWLTTTERAQDGGLVTVTMASY